MLKLPSNNDEQFTTAHYSPVIKRSSNQSSSSAALPKNQTSPIRESLYQRSPLLLNLGSRFECYRSATEGAEVASWQDGESWYNIRSTQPDQPSDGFTLHPDEWLLIHQGGTLSAVWTIGRNAFCKVKDWAPGMVLESDTINFVHQKFPQIPVPKVIYSWIDQDKSFVILEKVTGITLRDAWGVMSTFEQNNVLNEVVSVCNLLISDTSSRLQNVHGGPVLEPYLAHSGNQLLEPLTLCESKNYFFGAGLQNPEISGDFHLYHADLGPGNIIVRDNHLAAIIDWESLGYYPLFWIATKPSVSPGLDFDPPIPGVAMIEWRKRLRIALEENGLPRYTEWFMDWMKTKCR